MCTIPSLIMFCPYTSQMLWWISNAWTFSNEITNYRVYFTVCRNFNEWRHIKYVQTNVNTLECCRNCSCRLPTDVGIQCACTRHLPQLCSGEISKRYLLKKHAHNTPYYSKVQDCNRRTEFEYIRHGLKIKTISAVDRQAATKFLQQEGVEFYTYDLNPGRNTKFILKGPTPPTRHVKRWSAPQRTWSGHQPLPTN